MKILANFNLPKFTIMGNENRFSVYLLEKDVMEYVNAKNNYNKYDEQYSICEPTEKEENKRKKSFWYKKYLSKMKYLEEITVKPMCIPIIIDNWKRLLKTLYCRYRRFQWQLQPPFQVHP